MKLIKTSLLALVLLCLVTSCSKEESGTTEEINYSIDLNLAQETNWELADEILVLINEHRTSVGLSTISRDQQHASAYAVDHTKYMIEKDKISHDNFNYRNNALKNRGAKVVGEIVAFGYNDAESVVNAWLNSPSHKEIINNPSFTDFGISTKIDSDGKYYYTNIFIKK